MTCCPDPSGNPGVKTRSCSDAYANRAFWLNKFQKNIERDTQNQVLLSSKGWKIVIVWQCELSRKDQREKTIKRIVEKIKINSDKTLEH